MKKSNKIDIAQYLREINNPFSGFNPHDPDRQGDEKKDEKASKNSGKPTFYFSDNAKRTVKKSDIKRKLLICPYCFKELTEDNSFCCKEINHYVDAIELIDGDICLPEELKIIK